MRTSRTAIALALCACGNAKDPPKAAPITPAAAAVVIDARAPVFDAPLAPLTKLAPQPVLGPYKGVFVYCDEQPTENRRGDPMPCNDDRPHVDGPIAVDVPTPPYDDVHLFPVDAGIECSLAITTGGHVYVADRAIGCDWPGKTGLAITELALHGNAIVVRWERRSTFSIGGVTTAEIEDDAIVCGVGPSGKPSCTPTIALALERRPKGKGGTARRGAVTMTISDDGRAIDLEGDPKSLVLDAGDEFRAENSADMGRHAIAFP